MKELTIEQKAQAYDKAIERGLDYIRHTSATEMVTCKDVFEAIFPEFAEPKDEKLRREMLQIAKESEDSFYMVLTPNKRETLIALLEKQGQQSEKKEINLAEILKHYPRETELYSPLYGKLWLAEVDEECGIITCYKHPLEKGCTRAILKQEDTVSFFSNGTTGLPDCSVSDGCMLFLYDCEKQSEQKPYSQKEKCLHCQFVFTGYCNGTCIFKNQVEPKFKVGNWYQCTKDFFGKGVTFDKNTAYYCAKEGCLQDEYGCHIAIVKDLYDNFKLWTIQDAKEGDVLAEDSCIFIIEKMNPNGTAIVHCCLFDDGEFDSTGSTLGFDVDSTKPATKEQRDLLFQKMQKFGYEWDANKKELIDL